MGHPADRWWRHDRGALKPGDGDILDLVTPTLIASLTGLFAGSLLTIWGWLVLRKGRLHTRQGAAVLVAAVVVIGLMLMCASIVLLVANL